jgi:2-polyprenyl-6-methoxyphenol hydroxylase-like FAD-dependent oxidoreductase
MPLLDAVLTLALIGLWIFCLLDVITTAAGEVRTVPKLAWLLIVALLGAIGGVAWLVFGRPRTRSTRTGDTAAQTWPQTGGGRPFAASPGPPGRASGRAATRPERRRPLAPDDDPEFLRQLDERIKRRGREGPTP